MNIADIATTKISMCSSPPIHPISKFHHDLYIGMENLLPVSHHQNHSLVSRGSPGSICLSLLPARGAQHVIRLLASYIYHGPYTQEC